MVDKRKLLATMAFHGDSQTSLCRKIGINTSTFNGRIHGVSDFKASEIQSISRLYGLSDHDMRAIFFADELEKTQN